MGCSAGCRRAHPDRATGSVSFDGGGDVRTRRNERDPYERQAEAFLHAVEAGDRSMALSTYDDALRTDRLTRAVVAATGRPG